MINENSGILLTRDVILRRFVVEQTPDRLIAVVKKEHIVPEQKIIFLDQASKQDVKLLNNCFRL